MQSSRDSSVWRSLAVAFGDGLAFGVGMKLTQPSGRAPVAAPEADLSPLALRLEQMEQRIREIETAPRTLAAQPFDQKVLEAVVTALDARLRENSSQVERRITELQAKITIELKTLHEQDRSIAGDFHELEEQFRGQLDALRKAAEADRQSMREYLASLRQDVAGLVDGQLSGFRDEVREELRQVNGKLAVMAASAADSAIENRMAPLRTALEARDREIAELRTRLVGSDQATLDLLQGVGEICRRAAQRIATPEAPPPEAPPETVEAEAIAPDAPVMESVPEFAEAQPPGKLWRVPLVSSLVLTSGVMLMLHYL